MFRCLFLCMQHIDGLWHGNSIGTTMWNVHTLTDFAYCQGASCHCVRTSAPNGNMSFWWEELWLGAYLGFGPRVVWWHRLNAFATWWGGGGVESLWLKAFMVGWGDYGSCSITYLYYGIYKTMEDIIHSSQKNAWPSLFCWLHHLISRLISCWFSVACSQDVWQPCSTLGRQMCLQGCQTRGLPTLANFDLKPSVSVLM
jgi:hypothetical protein